MIDSGWMSGKELAANLGLKGATAVMFHIEGQDRNPIMVDAKALRAFIEAATPDATVYAGTKITGSACKVYIVDRVLRGGVHKGKGRRFTGIQKYYNGRILVKERTLDWERSTRNRKAYKTIERWQDVPGKRARCRIYTYAQGRTKVYDDLRGMIVDKNESYIGGYTIISREVQGMTLKMSPSYKRPNVQDTMQYRVSLVADEQQVHLRGGYMTEVTAWERESKWIEPEYRTVAPYTAILIEYQGNGIKGSARFYDQASREIPWREQKAWGKMLEKPEHVFLMPPAPKCLVVRLSDYARITPQAPNPMAGTARAINNRRRGIRRLAFA